MHIEVLESSNELVYYYATTTTSTNSMCAKVSKLLQNYTMRASATVLWTS